MKQLIIEKKNKQNRRARTCTSCETRGLKKLKADIDNILSLDKN